MSFFGAICRRNGFGSPDPSHESIRDARGVGVFKEQKGQSSWPVQQKLKISWLPNNINNNN